jgi:hypothetical protein
VCTIEKKGKKQNPENRLTPEHVSITRSCTNQASSELSDGDSDNDDGEEEQEEEKDNTWE